MLDSCAALRDLLQGSLSYDHYKILALIQRRTWAEPPTKEMLLYLSGLRAVEATHRTHHGRWHCVLGPPTKLVRWSEKPIIK